MNAKSVDVAGTNWHVVDSGSGPVILLVHGYPLDHSMWRFQIAGLSDQYRVIAPDLAGFGKSELNSIQQRDDLKAGSMAMMADELAAMLDSLNIDEPVVFCGLSMGGYVGWEFFKRHRIRLRGLIACDTRAAADTPEVARGRRIVAETVLRKGSQEIAEGLIGKLFGVRSREIAPERIVEMQNVIGSAKREAVAAASYAMARRADSTGLLPQLDLPALIVVGEQDTISTVEEMRGIADAISDARFVVLEDAGHMAPLECPERFNTVVKKFLAECL